MRKSAPCEVIVLPGKLENKDKSYDVQIEVDWQNESALDELMDGEKATVELVAVSSRAAKLPQVAIQPPFTNLAIEGIHYDVESVKPEGLVATGSKLTVTVILRVQKNK